MIEIIKWSESFESADTRKRQRLGWFLSPSGCDSKGFRRLMRDGKGGLESLGFFQALCQSMATMSIQTRSTGTFTNSDGTLMDFDDIMELSRLSGMDPADYRHIVGRLVACGWIRLHKSLESQQSAACLPLVCHLSPGFVQGEGEGQEEGKEKEPPNPQGGNDGKPESSKRERFKAPTISEVEDYGKTLTPPFVRAFEFVNFYESKGWIVGKAPMKSWQAAVRTWHTKDMPAPTAQRKITFTDTWTK